MYMDEGEACTGKRARNTMRMPSVKMRVMMAGLDQGSKYLDATIFASIFAIVV